MPFTPEDARCIEEATAALEVGDWLRAHEVAARRLGVPGREISDVSLDSRGLRIVDFSGWAYLVAPEDRPDGGGQCGLMMEQALPDHVGLPIYSDPLAPATDLDDLGSIAQLATVTDVDERRRRVEQDVVHIDHLLHGGQAQGGKAARLEALRARREEIVAEAVAERRRLAAMEEAAPAKATPKAPAKAAAGSRLSRRSRRAS